MFLKWVIGESVVLDSCITALGASNIPLYADSIKPGLLAVLATRWIALAISGVVYNPFKGFHASVSIFVVKFCFPAVAVAFLKKYLSNPFSATFSKYLAEDKKLFI